MALTATMYRFDIDLADVDRGVYAQLEVRAAQHPSESDAYLVTRVLAMALEHREGLEFGRGISVPDDPPLFVADHSGGGHAFWVEIGQPSADRLHKVAKHAAQVCVYTHKAADPILAALASGAVHRAEHITVVVLAPAFVDELAAKLSRKNPWSVLRSEGVLYVTVGDDTFQTTPTVHS